MSHVSPSVFRPPPLFQFPAKGFVFQLPAKDHNTSEERWEAQTSHHFQVGFKALGWMSLGGKAAFLKTCLLMRLEAFKRWRFPRSGWA